MSAETPLREALEAEWYNGNMTEGAYDRILAALAAQPVPTPEPLTEWLASMHYGPTRDPWQRGWNKAIEAVQHRAAADPSPSLDVAVRQMRYHPALRDKSAEFVAGWDAATVALLDAADPSPSLDAGCTCEPEHVWPCALIPRCDEPGCERETSCGFPTPTGYRRTCGEHMRLAAEAPERPA